MIPFFDILTAASFIWMRDILSHPLIPSSVVLYLLIWQWYLAWVKMLHTTAALSWNCSWETGTFLQKGCMHPPPLLPVEHIISWWCREGYNLNSHKTAWCHSVTVRKANNVRMYLSLLVSWQHWPHLKMNNSLKCHISNWNVSKY